MINKELIQENKWMREKLSSLSHQLMAVSVDVRLFFLIKEGFE